MADVFISFIHEEEVAALGVQYFVRAVFGEVVTPFLSSDTSAIYAGERWMDRIVEELKGAKVVIAILSPESVQRPWVNFEAGAAWVTDIVIIPACFKGLTKDTLPKPYSSLQAVNLESPDDQYYLVQSIAHYLGLPSPPSRFTMFQDAKEKKSVDPYEILKTMLGRAGAERAQLCDSRQLWQRRYVPFNVFTEKKRVEKPNYMHNNPVKRRVVISPHQWPWSSFRFYYLNDSSVLSMDRLA